MHSFVKVIVLYRSMGQRRNSQRHSRQIQNGPRQANLVKPARVGKPETRDTETRKQSEMRLQGLEMHVRHNIYKNSEVCMYMSVHVLNQMTAHKKHISERLTSANNYEGMPPRCS